MELEYVGPIKDEASEVFPLTVDELRLHSRIDSADDDTLVESYIKSATRMVENYLGKSLLSQTWLLWINGGFPKRCRGGDAPIFLNHSPVISVDKVAYVDLEGEEQELEIATLQKSLNGSNPKILPAYLENWPDSRCVLEAVRIEFTAGYGEAATDLPDEVLQAVRLIAASFYEKRELYTPDLKVQNLESYPILQLLLDPIRTRRVVAL